MAAFSKVPTKARLEALVDGIFAVAMTLLVLDIKLPEGLQLGSNARLLEHTLGVAQASPAWGMRTFLVLLVIHFLPHGRGVDAEPEI